jgi:transposase InsO family protein
MSHEQSVPSDYAGPVPTQRNPAPWKGAGTPPPRMPSDWLEPTSGDSQPVTEPEHDDVVVIVDDEPKSPACLTGPRPRPRFKGRLLVKNGDSPQVKVEAPRNASMAEHRVMILDTWKRSGLTAGDFAPLVGVSKHTLYAWKSKFEEDGPAGLMERRRGSNKGSRLSELTKRAILMMKQDHPDWGVDRISDLLLRSQLLAASPAAVAKVLHEDGFVCVQHSNRPHKGQVRYFEAKNPNSMWQTDLFTFVLKRQNQRVYLVAFMDDNSRFIVTYGLHASQSTALVLETFRAGIVSYGSPAEVLTDNGSQYVTWRGKSQFQLECQKRGIKQTVSSPRHPQTLGKIERFWGSLWRECLESAVFADLGDARIRIGHYIDHYNF